MISASQPEKYWMNLACETYRIGDAAISPWHANIFVNIGKASARDMRKLIEYAQKVVYDATWVLH